MSIKNDNAWEFLGSPVVRTFTTPSPDSILGQETKSWQAKKKKKKTTQIARMQNVHLRIDLQNQVTLRIALK